MTRTTWTLAFLFVALLTATPATANPGFRAPHIRSSETELLDAVRAAEPRRSARGVGCGGVSDVQS